MNLGKMNKIFAMLWGGGELAVCDVIYTGCVTEGEGVKNL
jgi:hypothetical protein